MKTGMTKTERAVLQRLAAGEEVRGSEMPERVRLACERGWVHAGFVESRSSGLRRVVFCARADRLPVFRQALEKAFPGYGEALPVDMTRAQAAKLQGHSKLAPLKDSIVVLRDFAGLFALPSESQALGAFWTSALEKAALPAGLRILTVENQDSFALVAPGRNGLPEFDLAVYTSGVPSQRLTKWLGSLQDVLVTHYGDFDYEGLRIFQMIRAQLPEQGCRLHFPNELQYVFARQRALGKGTMQSEQRRPVRDCRYVAEVLELIDMNGGVGVEQQVFDPEFAEV